MCRNVALFERINNSINKKIGERIFDGSGSFFILKLWQKKR